MLQSRQYISQDFVQRGYVVAALDRLYAALEQLYLAENFSDDGTVNTSGLYEYPEPA